MNSSESSDPKTPAEQADAELAAAASEAELEDRMLDVMLAELLEAQAPPDQRELILQRLNAEAPRPLGSKNGRGYEKSWPAWASLLAVASALLLAVGVTVGIRYRNAAGLLNTPAKSIAGETLADSQLGTPPQPVADPAAVPPKTPVDSKLDAAGDLPSRRIELADHDSTPPAAGADSIGMLPAQQQPRWTDPTSPRPVAQELTLVSASMVNHLQRYWQRVGLQPTELVAPETTVAKLRTKFGIDVPVAATGNVEAMRQALGQARNTQPIAVQVLAAISGRPAATLTRDSDQQMISAISDSLRSGAGFDRLYASWFALPHEDRNELAADAKTIAAADTTGEVKQNSEANQARPVVARIGELLRPLAEHEALVTTAAVALNTDMRCQRCHDLRRGGMGRHAAVSQHDYWQFAATVSPPLAIQPNAKSGWFYDTADGRRRLAERVADRNWPDRLTGSRALAQGLVAAIWAKLHGRPLVSSPYDLTGGAEDSDLELLRDDLADDLLAHDFDLRRTIALMLTDSILGRSTPAAMTPAGVLVASDEEWQRAVAAVESFAASPPNSMPSTRSQRLQLVQNSDLPTLRTDRGAAAMLAQPLGNDATGLDDGQPARETASAGAVAATPTPSPAVLAGLPMRPIVVMPAWVVELPDFDSRLQHIAHLAGLAQIPESARELAAKMRAADVEEALILQRIWWIIRPQG